MNRLYRSTFVFYALLFALYGTSAAYAADAVPLISKEDLKQLMSDPQRVTILDVRQGMDWSSSEFKIKGAIYTAPDKFDSWIGNYSKDQKIVLYCA
jgi:rhodanese-related sulfurtransferase